MAYHSAEPEVGINGAAKPYGLGAGYEVVMQGCKTGAGIVSLLCEKFGSFVKDTCMVPIPKFCGKAVYFVERNWEC